DDRDRHGNGDQHHADGDDRDRHGNGDQHHADGDDRDRHGNRHNDNRNQYRADCDKHHGYRDPDPDAIQPGLYSVDHSLARTAASPATASREYRIPGWRRLRPIN
ncbi:MAG TPA: hypothetical protein VD886_22325, partial [Herpetosiphonaceae bacterium]|nr:hypothetical protein [Herpetosiphonaceae bacterium]